MKFTTIISPYNVYFTGKSLIIENYETGKTSLEIFSSELMDPIDTMKEVEDELQIDVTALGYMFCEYYQTSNKA